MDIVQCGYQLLDAHLCWFHFFKFKFIYFNWRLITLQYCIFLILTNKAAMNIFLQVLEWMLLFGKYPVVGCLDHTVDGCLNF